MFFIKLASTPNYQERMLSEKLVQSESVGKLSELSEHDSVSQVTKALPELLVCDDEPLNIEVLKALLEERNHKVDTARDGVECFDLVKKRAELAIKGKAKMYKIIYSDYSMP